MGAIAVPILDGKLDEWRAWGDALMGERRADLEDFNRRNGLTRHRAYLQQAPNGGHLVIAIHDGPGGDTFMGSLAASDHPFDVWFREHLTRIHGIDFSAPPPPPSELVLDVGAGAQSPAAPPADG